MLSDYLSMAARNVRRGRTRTILTSLAISIGIASVLLLTAIGESGKNLINSKLDSVGINGIMVFTGDYDGLTVSDGERIRSRISEVSSVMPFETAVGYYSLHGTKTVSCVFIGVDEMVDDYMAMKVLHGRLFTPAECRNGSKVCVVGADFAQEEFKRENIVGKKVDLVVNNVTSEYTVIGVVHSTLNDLSGMFGFQIPGFIYVPYSAMSDDGSLGQLAVKVSGGADTDSAVNKIKALLKKTNANGKYFQIENLSGYMQEFDSILSVITYVLSATAAISLFVAGIGIMNSMLATVSDRQAEIGICKAIGATSGQIALIFMTESFILTLFGGLCGLALGLVAAYAVFSAVGVELTISLYGILLPCAVTLAIGLASGILPAVSAARLQPIIAIRKE